MCEYSGSWMCFYWGGGQGVSTVITRFLHFSDYFSYSQLIFLVGYVLKRLLKTAFVK